ncbi:MAG: cysteine--tRNA ligase [Cypionkella sp.]|uniref:cysteine--tRNA ligase n=1 Tax=Cypionkella sp. TaxID=2811411 RepID=UPI002AB8487F|nr:cysteine--tRNA ligase [Cypionkella sp.]MDZ4312401.1 cysteine--tRNA ligase [Cypionkella sp.]
MIKLHNTKTRAKEIFTPIDPDNVRMYVCGPTVYDRAHLGNGRPVVVFDVLYRLLRHVYGADHVTYVRNFTDVDDKINATALARQQAGDARPLEALIRERTEETIQWYHDDMDALGALRPNFEPRATEYIGPMVAMIEGLIASGHAYAVEGHVLFRVRSYKNYGALSGRSIDDMIAGARVEVAPYKEDPMDFVLWKPSSGDEPGWDSPWGRGRPGWHIECSAMSFELLGPSFDIHGGGLDLQFPHHENEIAQSCCAHPKASFANVWMHNEMLQVEGKKMSKSLGNFFTVRDLLEQGVVGEVIRFVFLKTHYRKPTDWTESEREVAVHHLENWNRIKRHRLSDPARDFDGSRVAPEILAALEDDLNTPLAMTHIFRMANEVASASNSKLDSDETIVFFDSLAFLGFVKLDTQKALRRTAIENATVEFDLQVLSERLQDLRATAMASKNFQAVDALKADLQAAGIEVQMSKSGVSLLPTAEFDPAKLESLK